jgi:uncharacterized protein YaiI (UPF0178 family)
MASHLPTVWIDADALPRAIREVLLRACRRRGVAMMFVANRYIPDPPAPNAYAMQVEGGPDVADDHIAENAVSGDLVITNDVPLAARVCPVGIDVIRPYGAEITAENVDEVLSMRDMRESLREIGVQTGGPRAFDNKATQRFANALDRWLSRNLPR